MAIENETADQVVKMVITYNKFRKFGKEACLTQDPRTQKADQALRCSLC